MIKLSIGELEEAIRDPKGHRTKAIAKTMVKPYYPISFYVQLKNSIYRYHSSQNNPVIGEEYLTVKLAQFKSEIRKRQMFEQYYWYVNDCFSNGIQIFDWRKNITISGASADILLTGEISRWDIRDKGGYDIWLFRKSEPDGWEKELRMPLIQDRLSTLLNSSTDEIYIGIYSFNEKYKSQMSYSLQEINTAKQKLNSFLINYSQLL